MGAKKHIINTYKLANTQIVLFLINRILLPIYDQVNCLSMLAGEKSLLRLRGRVAVGYGRKKSQITAGR